jgi:hypothetical protein
MDVTKKIDDTYLLHDIPFFSPVLLPIYIRTLNTSCIKTKANGTTGRKEVRCL